MIILDASATIALLLGHAPKITARVAQPGEKLHAPHLLDIEVAHVLRRMQAAGSFDAEHGRQRLLFLAALDIERHAHVDVLPRIWELRHNITAYDAVYVALAEGLGATLVTLDGRLARSTGHHAQIELGK